MKSNMAHGKTGKTSTPPKHFFQALRAFDSLSIPNFMLSEGGLCLSDAEVKVFALIYNFSVQTDAGEFYGSTDYICTRLGLSRASVMRALSSLLERELIVITGKRASRRGSSRNVYSVNNAAIARAAEEFAKHWSDPDTAPQPSKPSFRSVSMDAVENSPAVTQSQDIDKPPQDDVVENSELTVSNLDSNDDLAEETVSNLDSKPRKLSQIETHNIKNININPIQPDSPSCLYQGDLPEPQAERPAEPRPQPQCASESSRQIGRTDGRADGQSIDHQASLASGDAALRAAFDDLDAITVNRNLLGHMAGREATFAAFAALASDGFTPSQIARAWRHRQQKAHRDGKDVKFFPQLKRWLESRDAEGARAMCASVHKRAEHAGNSAALPAWAKREANLASRFYALGLENPQFNDLLREYDRAKAPLAAGSSDAEFDAAKRREEELFGQLVAGLNEATAAFEAGRIDEAGGVA